MGISERLTFTDIKSFVTIFRGFEKVDLGYMQEKVLNKNSTFKEIMSSKGGRLHVKLGLKKNAVHDFPFAKFEKIVHDLDIVIKSDLLHQVKNKITVLKTEWSSAVESCTKLNTGCSNFYGINDGDYIYVQPWESVYQVTSFHSQIRDIFFRLPIR